MQLKKPQTFWRKKPNKTKTDKKQLIKQDNVPEENMQQNHEKDKKQIKKMLRLHFVYLNKD